MRAQAGSTCKVPVSAAVNIHFANASSVAELLTPLDEDLIVKAVQLLADSRPRLKRELAAGNAGRKGSVGDIDLEEEQLPGGIATSAAQGRVLDVVPASPPQGSAGAPSLAWSAPPKQPETREGRGSAKSDGAVRQPGVPEALHESSGVMKRLRDAANKAAETRAATLTPLRRFIGIPGAVGEGLGAEIAQPQDAPLMTSFELRHARNTQLNVLENSEELKQMVHEYLYEPDYNVEDYYKKNSCWSRLATWTWFDNGTMLLVAFNAIWIMVDTDHNKAETLLEASPLFFTLEQFFCFAFTMELFVRFMAFERKRNFFKDYWCVFDLLLVTLMVFETWVLTIVLLASQAQSSQEKIGDTSVLRLGRILRLLRMSRISRLMRTMPEFFILLKAFSTSARSTGFTLMFLFTCLYMFGIAFTQLLEGTRVGGDSFHTVSQSMETLFFGATLQDNITDLSSAISAESTVCHVLLYFVILVCAISLMNILIGVLCEAISSVADEERTSIQVKQVKDLLGYILFEIEKDDDKDGKVSKEEFVKILQHRGAVKGLSNIGIDVISLIDEADAFFEESEYDDPTHTVNFDKKLPFDEFMDILLSLRTENKAKVKDVIDLKKLHHRLARHVDRVRHDVVDLFEVAGMIPSRSHKAKQEAEGINNIAGDPHHRVCASDVTAQKAADPYGT